MDWIVVPEVPALIGVRFFQQFLQAEFGTGGAFALSSSNGLDVTVGAFLGVKSPAPRGAV